MTGMRHWTYLIFELGWALPVIVLQWVVGRDFLLARWRILLLGVAIPTLYLCAADAFAIRIGIWHLNPELTTNVWLGGLPLEEGVFFLLTNVMVVQGLLLVDAGRDKLRVPGLAGGAEAKGVRRPR